MEVGIAMKGVSIQKEGDDQAQYLPRDEGDEKKSLYLPLDLIIEILTKLPAKSVSKLICVSKLWSSIIRGKPFTELYLARSSTRPRLLFQFYGGICNKRFFHSASQENPSSDDRAITTRNLDPLGYIILPPIRGLICYPSYYSNVVICNPSTSQVLTLPKFKTSKLSKYTFFGYDPVNDAYKVLCMTHGGEPIVSEEHQVFTLGAQEREWRMIKCNHPHFPVTQGLYRNGVMYYGAWTNKNDMESGLLVSFDFRFEEFSLIEVPENVRIKGYYISGLVNYNGKIALVDMSRSGKFEFWVLEDFTNNQEWLKFTVSVPFLNEGRGYYCCSGIVSTGELVFSPRNPLAEFIVVYYDPKEDKVRRVKFQSREKNFTNMLVFLDHVESPMFLPS